METAPPEMTARKRSFGMERMETAPFQVCSFHEWLFDC